MPSGNTVLVVKVGNVELDRSIKLNNVLFVPNSSRNLISIHKLTRDLDCLVTYKSNSCVIQDQATKRMIRSGSMHDGVYVYKDMMRGTCFANACEDTTILWHSRMGHPSSQALKHLFNFIKCNFEFNKLDCCDVCHRSKQCKPSFPLGINKAKGPFDLIHCDLWGRYHTTSHNGSHYFLTIVDDYTRGTWVYLMKQKTQIVEILMSFCNMIKTQFNVDVKRIWSDNGTEFMNSGLHTFLQQRGILHESSCAGTPQQNGRVERKHRHILNVARALRF